MNTLRLVDEFDEEDFDDEVEMPGDVHIDKLQLNHEGKLIPFHESLESDTHYTNKYIQYSVDNGISVRNTTKVKSAQDLVELRNEIDGFLTSSKEIADAEAKFDAARNNPEVDPEDLMDMQSDIQDLKESKKDDLAEENDLWTIVYAELAQDGAEAAENTYKKSALKAPKKLKYKNVDPVNDFDLRVYAANEGGFDFAKKVADYHSLKYKIEPTNRIHQTRFPEEQLQMTIFIPKDKIALK